MKKILYLISFLFAVALVGCEEKEPPTPPAPETPAKIETGAAENITSTSATLKGMVNVDIIDYEELVFGVLYSTKAEELDDFTAPSKNGLVLIGNEFKVNITDLKAETKYYYRAYVMLNNLQILLGDVKEFTTLEKNGSDEPEIPEEPETPEDPANGHAYVDLGLSVRWATMNVGANAPEECGDYFAWGETQPKEEYNWSTYKWCEGNYDTQTKYCTDSYYGTVDNKTILDLEDDAATVNWGGAWRMPTKEELQELLEDCTWTKVVQNDHNCYMVTGPNGNTIILPAAGVFDDTIIEVYNTMGCYWSSSLSEDSSSNAYYLYFSSGEVDWDGLERFYGLSIRPVLP